jgi:hypothetical protein
VSVPRSGSDHDIRLDLGKAIVVGALAGFLSGLFGVGGGILIVPFLVLLTGMSQRLAHGTSLVAIIPIAASGVVGYVLADKVDYTAGACIAVGGMAGAILGTKALHALPQHVLRIVFALVLLVTAARMILGDADVSGRGALDGWMVAGFVLLGLAAGVLSGLLGVGGGIVMVPVMILGFGIPAAIAKGTSLLVILPTSMVGTWRNVRYHNAKLDIGTAVGLAGAVTAFLGALLSIGLSDEVSAALFATLLVFIAARMLLLERRGSRAPE